MTTIVNSPPPIPSDSTFCPEFCSFIDQWYRQSVFIFSKSSSLQKDEENAPDCAALLIHPWIKSISDKDDSELKIWLTETVKKC